MNTKYLFNPRRVRLTSERRLIYQNFSAPSQTPSEGADTPDSQKMLAELLEVLKDPEGRKQLAEIIKSLQGKKGEKQAEERSERRQRSTKAEEIDREKEQGRLDAMLEGAGIEEKETPEGMRYRERVKQVDRMFEEMLRLYPKLVEKKELRYGDNNEYSDVYYIVHDPVWGDRFFHPIGDNLSEVNKADWGSFSIGQLTPDGFENYVSRMSQGLEGNQDRELEVSEYEKELQKVISGISYLKAYVASSDGGREYTNGIRRILKGINDNLTELDVSKPNFRTMRSEVSRVSERGFLNAFEAKDGDEYMISFRGGTRLQILRRPSSSINFEDFMK